MDGINYGFGLSRNTKFARLAPLGIPPMPNGWYTPFAQNVFDMPLVVECSDESLSRYIKPSSLSPGCGSIKHIVPPRVNEFGRRIGSVNKEAHKCLCTLRSKLQNADTASMHVTMATLAFCTTLVQIFSKEYEQRYGDVTFERQTKKKAIPVQVTDIDTDIDTDAVSVQAQPVTEVQTKRVTISVLQHDIYYSINISNAGDDDLKFQTKAGVYGDRVWGGYLVSASDMVKWLTDDLSTRLIALLLPTAPASGV